MSSSYSLCELCARRQGIESEFTLSSGEACFICRGLSSSVEAMKVKGLRALRSIQFETFATGTIIPAEVQEREDRIRSELKIRGGETMKTQVSAIVAHAIRARTGKGVDKLKPDVTLVADFTSMTVRTQPKPLFVRARYSKPRGVPQRMYFCEECGGKGCEKCAGTGYRQTPSVESVTGSKLASLTGANRVKFTWLGSEDPDSEVFPPGRPFLAELKGPNRRKVPSRLNLRTGNGLVRLSGLRTVPEWPAILPGFVTRTRMVVTAPERPSPDSIRKMKKALKGSTVRFQTTKGKMVEKEVYDFEAQSVGKRLTCVVKMDGGLPVKRFVSGDNIYPSLSEALGMQLKCERFDVLRVWENRSKDDYALTRPAK